MRSILFTAVYLSLNLCMRFVLINTEIVELTLFHFGAFVFYQLNEQKRTFILTIQCGHINNHHTLRSKSIYSSNTL